MSRRTPSDNAASFTLFPFIAVLLCTMGGLVVLLVSMAQVSQQLAEREQETEAASPPAPPGDADAAKRLAAVQDAHEKLLEAERQARERLREEQLRLAQIEEHVRALQEKGRFLTGAGRRLASEQSKRLEDRAEAERRVAHLKQLRDDMVKEIEALKEEAANEKSYAIVPYKGPNGTRRPPIYIECVQGKVILQPEGVVFTPEDFAGPLGVGNPLSAALRATREYMMRDNPNAGMDAGAEPYPLILVRQDGIKEYYDVRKALKSWESDFGYEMVNEDWEFDYGPANPELSNIASQAVETARMRRSMLARAAPSAFRGAVVSKAPSDAPGAGGFDGQPYEAAGPSGGTGARGDWVGRGDRANGAIGATPEAAGADDEGFGGASDGGAFAHPGRHPRVATTHGSVARHEEGSSHEGGQRPAESAQAEAATSGGANRGALGEARASGESGRGGEASGNAAGGRPGAAAGRASTGNQSRRAASLNKKDSSSDVAIRRGVPLTVFADRVLIGDGAQSVPLPGATREHFGDVVEAVERHVRAWGIAGQGLYWRPVIRLDVRHGGQRRAEEIAQGMAGGGVDVEYARTAERRGEEARYETR